MAPETHWQIMLAQHESPPHPTLAQIDSAFILTLQLATGLHFFFRLLHFIQHHTNYVHQSLFVFCFLLFSAFAGTKSRLCFNSPNTYLGFFLTKKFRNNKEWLLFLVRRAKSDGQKRENVACQNDTSCFFDTKLLWLPFKLVNGEKNQAYLSAGSRWEPFCKNLPTKRKT